MIGRPAPFLLLGQGHPPPRSPHSSLLTPHGHEAHRRSCRRLTDRLGIDHVVLLALDEGFDIGGRDQPHLVAEFADLTAPEMHAAAGLLRSTLRPEASAPMGLDRRGAKGDKHILRQIEPNRDNLQHDRSPLRIVADPDPDTQIPSGDGRTVTSSMSRWPLGCSVRPPDSTDLMSSTRAI